jgi:hypothetical protein
MPTLMELQKRLKTPTVVRHSLGSEEVLISDVRAQMRPGDFIAQKLQAAMVNGSAVTSPRTPARSIRN